METEKIILAALLFATPAVAQHAHHASPATATASADSVILAAQLAGVRRATERYLDHANAVSDGFRKFGADGPLMGEHWYHPDRVKEPVDLARPATLQYALINGRRSLVGVAYNLYQRAHDPLPNGFEGGDDQWHVHDLPKLARTLVQDRPMLRWLVNRRIEQGKVGAGDERTHLVMVHAWVWSENPDGMFAQQQRALPYLRAGLPAAWASGADLDAAWGAATLSSGCDSELDRLHKLARLARDQRNALSASCTRASELVSAARVSSHNAETFNRAAAAAWREFSKGRDSSLTSEQKRRLGSVMEPMMAH